MGSASRRQEGDTPRCQTMQRTGGGNSSLYLPSLPPVRPFMKHLWHPTELVAVDLCRPLKEGVMCERNAEARNPGPRSPMSCSQLVRISVLRSGLSHLMPCTVSTWTKSLSCFDTPLRPPAFPFLSPLEPHCQTCDPFPCPSSVFHHQVCRQTAACLVGIPLYQAYLLWVSLLVLDLHLLVCRVR